MRNPAVVLGTGGDNTLPDVPIATVQPTRDATAYRIGASAAKLVTVGNTSAHGHAARVLAPVGETINGTPAGLVLAPGEVVTLSRGERSVRPPFMPEVQRRCGRTRSRKCMQVPPWIDPCGNR